MRDVGVRKISSGQQGVNGDWIGGRKKEKEEKRDQICYKTKEKSAESRKNSPPCLLHDCDPVSHSSILLPPHLPLLLILLPSLVRELMNHVLSPTNLMRS